MSWTDTAVEEALEALGVEIVGASGDEIQAFCPVHRLTVGRRAVAPPVLHEHRVRCRPVLHVRLAR